MKEPRITVEARNVISVPARSKMSGGKNPEKKSSVYLSLPKDIARMKGIEGGDLVSVAIIAVEKKRTVPASTEPGS